MRFNRHIPLLFALWALGCSTKQPVAAPAPAEPAPAPAEAAPPPPAPAPPPVAQGWGEEPTLAETERGACVTFSGAMMLFTNEGVALDTTDRAEGCVPSDAAKVIEAPQPEDIRGAVGALIFATEDQGSDFYNLYVFDATLGKMVFRREWVSPVADTRVDAQQRQLIYADGLGTPGDCAEEGERYAEWEAACWETIQQTHPALREAPAPGCECGDSGLEPYVLATFVVPLDDLSAKASPQLPLICGCAS